MTLPMHTVLGLGGIVGSATEALPSPTLFVAVYGIAWLVLVGWTAWLVTQQHGLDRGVSEVQARLQSRLDQMDRPAPHTD
jgi:hypothetical protein